MYGINKDIVHKHLARLSLPDYFCQHAHVCKSPHTYVHICTHKKLYKIFSHLSNSSLALLWMKSGEIVLQSPIANMPSAPSTLM